MYTAFTDGLGDHKQVYVVHYQRVVRGDLYAQVKHKYFPSVADMLDLHLCFGLKQ